VTAIARRTDGEDAIEASTDFLAKRPVHDVDAAARFDWTRRLNRGTRETTGSVRRSIEAVTEGLEGSAPGPHLDPPQGRQPISSNPVISRGARRQLLHERGVITKAAERLHGSSMTADFRDSR
jgi:hypothetical protein